MNKKQKLQQLLERVRDIEDALPLRETEEYSQKLISDMAEKMRGDASVQYLEKIHQKLGTFKKDFDLTPLADEITALQKEIASLSAEIEKHERDTKDLASSLKQEIETILQKITEVENMPLPEVDTLSAKVDRMERGMDNSQFAVQTNEKLSSVNQRIDALTKDTRIASLVESVGKQFDAHNLAAFNLAQEINVLRQDMLERLSVSRGGSAHRQININSSVMSTRYTDINFTEGGNIGWSATNDDTNKRVNIRASVLIGGGGGSGITRFASIISVSSTFGATALTDYVAFANVGIRTTLPTAIGNSNLYTIKNTSTSSVLVATTEGQTIDGSDTALMSVENESLSFMSNGSVWGVV
jgi:outer membrane murein-binding lipoprotein Lpp